MQENSNSEFSRVVCFALIKFEDRLSYVSPMVCMEDTGEIESASFFSNFGGIVFSKNPYEDYKDS